MDLWVGAAAAGAGYFAKHLQNIFRDEEGVSECISDRSFLDDPQSSLGDRTCAIKKLSRLKSDIGNSDLIDDKFAETSMRGGLIGSEETCSSALNQEQPVGSSYELGAGMSGVLEDITLEMEVSRSSRRNKNALRSTRLHLPFIKPRSSLDSCVMAQMDREHIELEEYLRTPLSSPRVPPSRPYFISDGKRLIRKPRGTFMNGPKVSNEVVGIPRLPIINPVGVLKQKLHSKSEMGKSYFSGNLMQFDTGAGCSSGKAIFCLGISIGILSTIIANKAELKKLNESLKTSENLVKDLQDELEMKDSLTVKELVNDDDSHDVHGILCNNENSDVFSNPADINGLIRHPGENAVCLKKDDSISIIEAELEAELERMGLSMKGSTSQGEVTQDFDQGLVSELVYGELQADTICRRSSSETTLDRGSPGIPTPHSTKNGVSPHELSFRLHEVIRLRLEERIAELETELTKTQNHVHHLISHRGNYWKDVSTTGSSPSRYSPRVAETYDPTQPLVMNMSGDALDALEELNILNQSKNESPHKPMDKTTRFSGGSNTWLAGKREEAIPISITGIPSSEDSPNDNYNSGNSDDDDMLLIRQIVEKARQGSPAILRAQKAMVSLNRGH